MFRQHQVRTPGMFDGMAQSFQQEALRAMQDSVPLHKAIRCEHATEIAVESVCKESLLARRAAAGTGVQEHVGDVCMVELDTLANKMGLAVVLLDCRCGLGTGSSAGCGGRLSGRR